MLTIINANLITISQGNIENGKVVINNGKIIDLGADIIVPKESKVYDAKGRYVTPGLIDAHTHVGIHESGTGWEGSDGNESADPLTPFCSVRDGINMKDPAFESFRKSGITSVGILPGSTNILGGTGLALKCKDVVVDEAIIKDPVGMKVALGENPKKHYGEKRSPISRMANASMLRESLLKARQYLNKLELKNDVKRDPLSVALLPVIKKEIPLIIHCHRQDDIATAIRICKEFDVSYRLEHVTEGHMILELIKSENVHCCVGPCLQYGSKVENRNRDFKTAVVFEREGVSFCLTTDHPVVDGRNLMLTASIATQWGVSDEKAFESVTLAAAKHMGVAERVGSLEIGKDGDLVVWSGHPLEFTSFVDMTLIEGEVVYDRGIN
ncbi:amidohydrolase [Alkalibacter mobilis]|uniref:amidohydrolase n=1 Tax=Alkalibacter mobilis TaxID=2787712 RepID=UPI00189CB23A|nr:amidohydrolase [Alkalibacter mobilis]MBF7097471.1 amidohydrolase [Alkalibacter mobilis]